jgi:hypothetical protein
MYQSGGLLMAVLNVDPRAHELLAEFDQLEPIEAVERGQGIAHRARTI